MFMQPEFAWELGRNFAQYFSRFSVQMSNKTTASHAATTWIQTFTRWTNEVSRLTNYGKRGWADMRFSGWANEAIIQTSEASWKSIHFCMWPLMVFASKLFRWNGCCRASLHPVPPANPLERSAHLLRHLTGKRTNTMSRHEHWEKVQLTRLTPKITYFCSEK